MEGFTTTDLVFETLRDRHRRHILCLLVETADESGQERIGFDRILSIDEHSETTKTALYHNHLPRLAESGFIEWDRVADSISRGPRFDEIEPVVALLDDHRDRLPGEWP